MQTVDPSWAALAREFEGALRTIFTSEKFLSQQPKASGAARVPAPAGSRWKSEIPR